MESSLTPREIEVLQHIGAGQSNKEIAQQLSVSIHTVESHVRHVLEKLDAKSRTDALQKAIVHGLLVLPLPTDKTATLC